MLCGCGCGRETEPAVKTDRHKGWVRGEPRKFWGGHSRRRIPPAFQLSDLDVGWLAGLFEGEGCFITRPAPWYCRIDIWMTDEEVIERVAALLRRKVYRRPGGKAHWKPQFGVAVYGYTAKAVMTMLRPHMCARRKKQIDRCLAHIG